MITQICAHIKNYFEYESKTGSFSISEGKLPALDFISDGDYYCILGSRYNDGVHRHPAADLEDEEFCGKVALMAVPRGFLSLVSEIENYCADGMDKPSPYASESFGGYSYTRFSPDSGSGASWQKAFKDRLNEWRRL